MLKPIMTVRLDLRSCHGSGIPCSVSFQDDNIISTVSSGVCMVFMIVVVFNDRVRCVGFNCGRKIMMIM